MIQRARAPRQFQAAEDMREFASGLMGGIRVFREGADQIGFGMGENLGGIFGKPSADALTPGNRTQEICDPSELRDYFTASHRRKVFKIVVWALILVALIALALF
jgi:hypothetical protein